MPGFQVCVSTLYDIHTMMKLPNDALSDRIPVVKRRMTLVPRFRCNLHAETAH